MKRLIFVSTAVLIGSLSSVSFATVEPVECSTSTVFGDNECGVCYRESTAVTGTSTALEITGVKVPWKNTQTGISEVAFEIDNDVPKIISDHKIVTDPDTLDDLWKFTNPWTGIGEYALASGKETTLTELIPDGSIKVYGKGSTLSPTVLIKSELNYVDREVAKLKESESKTRNICLLYDLTFSTNNLNSGNSATTPPSTPATTPTTPTTTSNTTNTTTTPSATSTAPITPIAPIPKPVTNTASTTNTTTNIPATNTTTPPPTNTTNTGSTNTTPATNTPSTTTPSATATTQTNNAVTNPQTITPSPSTTNNTVQSYTSPVVQLNSAADPTTIAASKVPTGPGENMMFFFIAAFLSTLIYWKKQKNSV